MQDVEQAYGYGYGYDNDQRRAISVTLQRNFWIGLKIVMKTWQRH